MHFLKKLEIQKEKFRKKYYSKYPILYEKIISIEEINYLNLIDRTFYLIRLREQFYNKHQDVIGIEYADYDTEFKTSNISVNGVKKEYSFEDYIKSLDKTLIDCIAENLKFICEFYGLEPLDHALKKPTPLILGDPNLFAISPFLFSLKNWFIILQNDVSKLFGKPRTKVDYSFVNREVYASLKMRFRMFSTEVEKRIGSNEVKHYNVLFPPTIKIETEVLHLMLNDLKFNDLIGKKNPNLFADSLKLLEKIKLKEKVQFKISQRKIRKLYSYFFKNYLKINEDIYKNDLIYFADFFDPEQDSKTKTLAFPEFIFITDDLLKDYFILIRF